MNNYCTKTITSRQDISKHNVKKYHKLHPLFSGVQHHPRLNLN